MRAGVVDRLAVVRRVAVAIEVALADDVGRQRQPLRRLRQDVFDDEHRLRSAEAAERRLRRLVRAADAARHLDRRQLVGVVAVEQRAPHDRLGQVEAPAAVGVEREPQRLDAAVGGEAGGVARQVRMALAGQRHVELRASAARAPGGRVFHAPSAAIAA